MGTPQRWHELYEKGTFEIRRDTTVDSYVLAPFLTKEKNTETGRNSGEGNSVEEDKSFTND